MAIGIQLSAAVICTRCGKSTHNKCHYCDECYPVYLQKKQNSWKIYEQKQREKNAKGRRIYDLAFWKKLRMQILKRDNGLCVMCLKQGRLTPATDVDHIIPIFMGGTNSPDNLQSLCRDCHKQKTSSENKKPVTKSNG